MASRFLLLLWAVSFTIPSNAQQHRSQGAREQLNLGVQSYRAADYEAAIEHFNLAVHWDPDLIAGHLYLATAYAQQYVPGVDAPDNVAMATNAIEQYNEVLRRKPDDITAIKGVAFLNMQLKHFEQAKEGYKRAAAIDDKDPETFYSIGVIDWTIVFRNVTEEKGKLTSKSEYAMVMSSACSEVRLENLPTIEDGIVMLTKAIDLRKNYTDAMAYMNLLYRLRADLQCGDKKAHRADVRTADQWSDEAMEIRRKQSAGIVIENQPADGRSSK